MSVGLSICKPSVPQKQGAYPRCTTVEVDKHDMTCRKLGLTTPSDRNASATIGAISPASRVIYQTDVTFKSRLTSSLINLLRRVFPTSVHHRTSTPSRYSGSGFHHIFTPVKLTVIHSQIMISFVHTEPHPPQTDTT